MALGGFPDWFFGVFGRVWPSGPGRDRAGFGRFRAGFGPVGRGPSGPKSVRTARDRPGPGRIRTANPGQKTPAVIGGPTTRQKVDDDRWGQRSSSTSAVNEQIIDRPSIVHRQRYVLRSSMPASTIDGPIGVAFGHRRRSTSSMIVR